MGETLLLGLGLLLMASPSRAHETLPGTLEIRERPQLVHEIYWRAPIGSSGSVPVRPVIPEDCRVQGGTDVRLSADANLGSYQLLVRCRKALAGREVSIEGWTGGTPAVLLRFSRLNGGDEQHLLRATNPKVRLGGANDTSALLRSFFSVGFIHILLGPDHLLFVAGLMLLITGARGLLVAITTFTVAHSITIAASVLGMVRVPMPPIEFGIALSILFVAVEVVKTLRGKTSIASRYPWLTSFTFGLLHGFGFATALGTTGLGDLEISWALLAFNIGVEAGQLVFLLLTLPLILAWRRMSANANALVRLAPAYVLGTMGAYWTLDRLVGLFIGGA